MGEQLDRLEEGPNVNRLDLLERAIGEGQSLSREDQVWVVAELRRAQARLAESEAWTAADPSRIG